MNGVTGRMGYRQHLVRSILAIREQGGLDLGDGTTLWPEPILVGRREHALRALAEKHGLDPELVSMDVDEVLADPTVDVYFDAQVTAAREEAIRKAIAAGKHIYTEKPTATGLDGALELARLATAAGVKHGTADSSGRSSPSGASSATGCSRVTGRRPSGRPGTTGQRTAAASWSTCSRTGNTC
jgi:predicted dehydrogenase